MLFSTDVLQMFFIFFRAVFQNDGTVVLTNRAACAWSADTPLMSTTVSSRLMLIVPTEAYISQTRTTSADTHPFLKKDFWRMMRHTSLEMYAVGGRAQHVYHSYQDWEEGH